MAIAEDRHDRQQTPAEGRVASGERPRGSRPSEDPRWNAHCFLEVRA